MSIFWVPQIIFFFTCISGRSILLRVNEYDVLMKEISRCDEGRKLMTYGAAAIKKLKRNKYIHSTELMLNDGLHDGQTATLNIAAMSNGAWSENYFNMNGGPICSAAKIYCPKFFKNYLKSMGFTKCPIPPGNYSVRNVDISLDFSLPMIPVNKYRVDVIIEKKSVRIGCIRIITEVVRRH